MYLVLSANDQAKVVRELTQHVHEMTSEVREQDIVKTTRRRNDRKPLSFCKIYGRFAYGSFCLRSVRLRLESIRLRLICQFAYVLKHVLPQFIHLLYVRSRSDPSQSIQFLERDS